MSLLIAAVSDITCHAAKNAAESTIPFMNDYYCTQLFPLEIILLYYNYYYCCYNYRLGN